VTERDLLLYYRAEYERMRDLLSGEAGKPVRSFVEEGSLRMIVLHLPEEWDGVELLRRTAKVMELLAGQALEVQDRGAIEVFRRVSSIFRAVLGQQ